MSDCLAMQPAARMDSMVSTSKEILSACTLHLSSPLRAKAEKSCMTLRKVFTRLGLVDLEAHKEAQVHQQPLPSFRKGGLTHSKVLLKVVPHTDGTRQHCDPGDELSQAIELDDRALQARVDPWRRKNTTRQRNGSQCASNVNRG